MRVRQLKLNSFRNYADLDFTPGAGLNILYGENAQGKSNILEALSLLATTRSLRASRESELILRDCDMANVTAEVEREREGDVDLQVSVYQGDKKSVRVNGMKRARVVDLLGQFNAVFFGSIDLGIVTGEPSDRRHYLNIEISQISPRYVYDLGHYKRTLQQRNRLLRELRERPRPPEQVGLDVWNEQLVIHGAPILEKRRFYIDRLAPLADQIHRELTDGREGLEVRYVPSFALPIIGESSAKDESGNDGKGDKKSDEKKDAKGELAAVRETREDRYVSDAAANVADSDTDSGSENRIVSAARESTDGRLPADRQTRAESPPTATQTIAAAFQQALTGIGREEARRGTTLIGPQRDDLSFLINGAEARLYGSQGQQRTAALSLKLAEFRLIEDYVGETPVMLLDDVMSDLDDIRRKHLLHWITRRCQTFITCTSLRSFPKETLAEAATFRVVEGTVIPDARPIKTGKSVLPQSVGKSSAESKASAGKPDEQSDGNRKQDPAERSETSAEHTESSVGNQAGSAAVKREAQRAEQHGAVNDRIAANESERTASVDKAGIDSEPAVDSETIESEPSSEIGTVELGVETGTIEIGDVAESIESIESIEKAPEDTASLSAASAGTEARPVGVRRRKSAEPTSKARAGADTQ